MITDQEIRYIEKLLSAFFDGTTSATDEKELYNFFQKENIPDHLKPYQPIFEYFEIGIKEECSALPADDYKLTVQPRKKRWVMWSAVAASLLLVISVGTQFYAGSKKFDPYEGSYIVRNGVRMDEPEEIREELEVVTQRVRDRQREVEVLYRRISDVENPQAQFKEQMDEQRAEFLNRFENEYVRNEVIKMLKTTQIN